MAIDRLAKAEHIPKSTMARKRLEQYRIEKAIELYVNEKGSLKEISEITGVTVRMIMGTLGKKNIPLRMGEEVFDRGVGHARGVFGF
jgi:predicted HTH domain antitoxin